MTTRLERDSLGERQVPEHVYWGIQTLRARENFPISGLGPHPLLVRAMVLVKRAAAQANRDLGELDARRAEAVLQACDEALAGRFHDQFVVDAYQSGAGVSHHMNVNEVLANRAIEVLGGRRGDYSVVHPNDHVNRGQSTNDVFPTAAKLAALFSLAELQEVLSKLEAALRRKAGEFDGILKSGRTHTQDAVPIRLGQEFGAYAATIARNRRRLEQTRASLAEVNLGGTAVGTGLGAHPRFRETVVALLSRISGQELRPADNLFEATQNPLGLAEASGALKLLALDLLKMCHDLMLLGSGPRTGLAEITLPALQPGSSIMPGKVNPVMLEVLNMVCYQVAGNDLAVSLAAQGGQQELNVYMPLMAHNVLFSAEILKNAIKAFTERCVTGIKANEERCREYFEKSLGLATALSPRLGYETAARLAQEAMATGKTIGELARVKGVVTPQEWEELTKPERVT